VPGVVIDNPGCVSKTCPSFFDLWSTLEMERNQAEPTGG
jgi:5-enolpyruvylshikimate-3-phosphate synthase